MNPILDHTASEQRSDVAAFGLIHVNKEAAITAARFRHKCYPELSDLQCMVWHGDFELRGRIALQNRHGLSFMIVHNHLPIGDSSTGQDVSWNEESDEQDLLQIKLNKPAPVTLFLNDLIPHRTVVRLLSPDQVPLPDPLEVDFPGSSNEVTQELLRWGHTCKVYQCLDQPLFLCFCAAFSHDNTGHHYVFCHDDPADTSGTFEHSCIARMNALMKGKL